MGLHNRALCSESKSPPESESLIDIPYSDSRQVFASYGRRSLHSFRHLISHDGEDYTNATPNKEDAMKPEELEIQRWEEGGAPGGEEAPIIRLDIVLTRTTHAGPITADRAH